MLSNSAEKIRADDRAHYLHPWDSLEEWGQAQRFVAARGDGIYLWDAEGRRYIDGPGGQWCVNIGYGRHEMAEVAAQQMMDLPYYSPWLATAEAPAALAAKLADLAPDGMNAVQFTCGGSTAVDTAIRTVHFVNNRRGLPDKKIVIAREKGYHGSTFLAATVSGKERDVSHFDIWRERVHFLPDVAPNLRPDDVSLEDWCDRKVDDLERAIINIGPDRVGAFIAEPVLCSGGVIIPPPGYHQRTLEICRKYDVFYISDEVVTSFGRLGHWFASQDVFGIEPDFITTAKGLTSGYLPLGACLIHDRVLDMITGPDHDVLFPNGYTYSGHPVCCAVALKNIEIIETEGLLDHVKAVAPHFLSRLEALRASPVVGDVRGIGLVGCIEGMLGAGDTPLAVQRDLGARLDAVCEEMGLIVRPLINRAVFSPALIITKTQIDEMFDILEVALDRVATEFT
ncbi:MAG: aminotransferase class III-fold pyridoxal phosphate-dependent enzyme [Paracoccaceae bacterium]